MTFREQFREDLKQSTLNVYHTGWHDEQTIEMTFNLVQETGVRYFFYPRKLFCSRTTHSKYHTEAGVHYVRFITDDWEHFGEAEWAWALGLIQQRPNGVPFRKII